MYGKKNIVRISYPIFLGLLAQNIINVTDTAFLGHVGEIELGASAIGSLYYICLFTLAFGFSVGSQIIMARRNGEKNYGEIGKVLSQGSLFSMILAAVLLAVTIPTSETVIGAMLSSEAVTESAVAFFAIRVWGIPFSFLNTMFRAFYVSVTRTKVLTLNAIVMALINVFLDWALIFGNMGFPQMGIEGAALASVAAEAGSLLFFIVYTGCTVDCRKYGIALPERLEWDSIRNILSVSVFMMVQQFVPLATWFVFFLAIEHLGERELAIANVVRSIYILTLIPVMSLSTTVNTMVSNAMGADHRSRVMIITGRIVSISVLIASVCSVLMLMFPGQVLSVYTEDSRLIADAIPSLRVIAFSLVIASMSNIYFNCISGTGNARSALVIELAVQVVYAVYILVTGFVFRWPVELCFTCEALYYSLLLISSILYLKYGKWRNARV